MNEEFLHFIWKYRLFDSASLQTIEGQSVEVLRSGDPNPDAGPDFLNSRIRIGDTVWVGNVELHLRSSDWNRHKHQTDRAYENVILHLVHQDDAVVKDATGRVVPTIALKSDSRLMQNYHALRSGSSLIKCSDGLPGVDPFLVKQWLSRMMVERLEKRALQVKEILDMTGGDWQEATYRMLFQALGARVNSQPFGMLARSLPYKILLRHRENLFQIEALLFGQAGFLDEQLFEEDYPLSLRKEYQYLAGKYELKPMDQHLWKFLRLRPSNFPTIRIAQAAWLLHHGLMDFDWLNQGENLSFRIREAVASEYWTHHYQFHKASAAKKKRIGTDASDLLLINAVIPVMFAWAAQNQDQELKNKSLAQLEMLAPEQNALIRKWEDKGIQVKNAFDSQALLQLHQAYCSSGYCLRCAIGAKLVTRIES